MAKHSRRHTGPRFKTGKLPARPGAVKFKLTDYINRKALPKCPKAFGHEDLIGDDAWGLLGNADYGDCVFAGAAHETMLWHAMSGRKVEFNDQCVLSDYSAVTGFDPSKPDTDQGTDMEQAAAYRRKVGVLDAAGNRHQVAAYLALDPGDIDQLYLASWLFGAVGIGIEFPTTAMDQFNRRKPWSVVRGARIDGGHYLPLVAKRRYLTVVTWGREQPMTAGFLAKYCDEAVAYCDWSMLTNNKSPEGFDAAQLQADLAALKPAHR